MDGLGGTGEPGSSRNSGVHHNRRDEARHGPEALNISKVAAGVNAVRNRNGIITGGPSPQKYRAIARLFAGRTGVHVDFHADRHFDDFWSLPSHFRSPLEPHGRFAVPRQTIGCPPGLRKHALSRRFAPGLRRAGASGCRHLSLHLVSGRSRPSVSSADT